MSNVILHHYALSPYSEKVRLALGLKNITWSSVDIPVWTPRPKLTPMTGGYRKTPILQIGAEFYCDTLHILQAIEKLGQRGALYPKRQEAMAKAFGWWIEKSSFFNAVCLTIGNMPGIPQELIDERRPLFRVNLDPGELRSKRPLYLQRLDAQLAWLAEILSDGRKFILGDEPSAADLSAYHPLWFARQNGGTEVNDLIAFASVIDPWYKRVAAIGHGKSSEMTPDQAIEAARTSRPSEPDEWWPEAQNIGLRRGDWVSVTPDDYGNAVNGKLLAWTADEVVIRHEDPSVGEVNLRFPRVGFDTAPADRKAN
ncbi:glutathione S-transferase family protein [Bradyrhizobium guangzhouense]|uniref:glutathione S-transferase family protein n=1 Tax=Bradyrhizobium guangzhouense TaxID=1325095 RepID=UPI001009EF14|nr:glutathione S-transferase family protein [Bradyrhizobium guangzhouense]RXH16804.1 glutathione S-transferase family protein [Bradyrhizobium guangzhouense]